MCKFSDSCYICSCRTEFTVTRFYALIFTGGVFINCPLIAKGMSFIYEIADIAVTALAGECCKAFCCTGGLCHYCIVGVFFKFWY